MSDCYGNFIDPGLLRHRVTLQRSTRVPAPMGTSASWSDIGTYWAYVKPTSGKELVRGDIQVNATTSHEIVMRNNGPVFAKDRLSWTVTRSGVSTTTLLNIESVQQIDGQSEAYRILATQLQ